MGYNTNGLVPFKFGGLSLSVARVYENSKNVMMILVGCVDAMYFYVEKL